MWSFQTSISYSRQLNSATKTKSPPIGRLSLRALSLVETFSLFAFSPSLRNGVVAVARTKTNQGNLTCPKFKRIGKSLNSDLTGRKRDKNARSREGQRGQRPWEGGSKETQKGREGIFLKPYLLYSHNVHLVAGVEGQHPGDHKACDKASCEKGRRQKNIRAHLWGGF